MAQKVCASLPEARHALCFCNAVQTWVPLHAMQHAASVQLGCKAQADVCQGTALSNLRCAAEVALDPEEEEEQQQEPEGRPEHKFVYRLLKKPEIGRDLVGQKVRAAPVLRGRALKVSPSWATPWPEAMPVLGPSSWVASGRRLCSPVLLAELCATAPQGLPQLHRVCLEQRITAGVLCVAPARL